MRLHTWFLSLAAVTLVAAPALAQQPNRSPWASRQLQEELKLTEDQVKKATEISEKQSEALRAAMDKLTGEETRGEKGAEVRKKNREETMKLLADVLKEDQIKRYKQIQFQQTIYGFGGGFGGGRPGQPGGRQQQPFFAHPEVAAALKFDAEQKDKIKGLSEEYTKAMEAARQDAGMDFRKMFEARQKVTTEFTEKFMKGLSSEQQKTWEEVHGKRFQQQQGGRPGGGGTQPGRPGGQGGQRPPRDTN